MEMQTEGVILMPARKRSVGILVATLVAVLVAVVLTTAVDGAKAPASASDLSTPAGQPLDLVWMSDSMGWSVAGFYARHIRQDLGVGVRVRDKWEGDLTAVAVHQRPHTPGHPWIRLIRNAGGDLRNRQPVRIGDLQRRELRDDRMPAAN